VFQEVQGGSRPISACNLIVILIPPPLKFLKLLTRILTAALILLQEWRILSEAHRITILYSRQKFILDP
jgi:hypothetical protein